jgi:histidinol dehydrogenase (EC 1.1.1.23)
MDYRAVSELSPDERAAFFERDAGIDAVRGDVADIIDRVHTEGDVALRELAAQHDNVEVGNLDVTDLAERAHEDVDDEILAAISEAADNIRAFHEQQVPDDWREEFDGRELGRRFRPIERVGVYAPGGTAAYPSSVLMGVLPAKIAGVDHVAVATPPADPMNPVTLAAAHEAGADAIYAAGGAQAVAALAYGTETVTSVQKVVGPGNKWVTAAKRGRGDVRSTFSLAPVRS